MNLVVRTLTRYWGYLAAVLAVAGWFLHSLALAVVLALSLAALGYFLFQAPLWCGARTRKDQRCRQNSHGLLRGCSIREHKWQRLKETFTPAGARAVAATAKSAAGALTAFGGVIAGATAVAAAIKLTLH